MLSWVDAASYTERARLGYEALIDLKALIDLMAFSWHYKNLCGMCSDPQHSAPVLVLANHRNKSYDMHSMQRVGCTIVSLSTIYVCTRGHSSKSSSIVPTPNFHPSTTLHTDRWLT